MGGRDTLIRHGRRDAPAVVAVLALVVVTETILLLMHFLLSIFHGGIVVVITSPNALLAAASAARGSVLCELVNQAAQWTPWCSLPVVGVFV